MLYNVNDKLECIKEINAQCLEMTNLDLDIKKEEVFIVTDKDDYPDENECHWYELTSLTNENIVLNVWNDFPDHLVIDKNFKRI